MIVVFKDSRDCRHWVIVHLLGDWFSALGIYKKAVDYAKRVDEDWLLVFSRLGSANLK